MFTWAKKTLCAKRLNVFRMRLLGAKVIPVTSGTKTLKDATNEAMRDWVTNVRDTHYIIGSVVGPHPFPVMVRDFHAVTGQEARQQIQEIAGRLPDVCVACVGGGSNAMGIFYPFIEDESVRLNRRRSGGRRFGYAESRGAFESRLERRFARLAFLHYAGQSGANYADAFDFGGPRLSRRRAGTRASQRYGPRRIRRRHR